MGEKRSSLKVGGRFLRGGGRSFLKREKRGQDSREREEKASGLDCGGSGKRGNQRKYAEDGTGSTAYERHMRSDRWKDNVLEQLHCLRKV